MMARRLVVHRLMPVMLAALVVLAERAHAQDAPFSSPNPGDTTPAELSRAEKSSAKTEKVGESAAGKGLRDPRSTSEPADRRDQLRLGESYIGVKTEKSVPMSPLKRSDCTTDDECADYSGLPKSEPARRTFKSLRKPFLGLSISTPLQW
jgi:hypothetical protein